MTDQSGSHGRVSDARDPDGHRIGGAGLLAHVGRAIRVLLLASGVATLGFGLLVMFDPEMEGLLQTNAAIAALGSDYMVLALLALVAVGLALLLVAVRHVSGVNEASPPVVEGVMTATYPGASFDQADRGRLGRLLPDRSASARRERLRQSAIRATMHAEGCSRSDAGRRIDEGTWTNDSVAASFLSASRSGVLPSSVFDRSVNPDGDPANRTVDAIAAKTNGVESAGQEERS